ncbi:MAG: transcription termination factor NusA [Candidatus Saccharibacteria bacterium]|nr:transcription termination factor NusA [Candidatus Saccharibacteria bacterium]MCY4088882.1 transcription termination factor NusA [Candidatus Saccharibacteria bacterium]
MEFDIKELLIILKSLAEEKNLEEEVLHDIVEQAVATAWKRDHGDRDQNVRADLDFNQGIINIYVIYEVVDKVEDDQLQISLKDAQAIKSSITVGQTIEKKHQLTSLGRIAAQTAKQVILQKLRETEREVLLAEYENKIGSLMIANVTKVDSRMIRCEIGRIQGIMPKNEQIPHEDYRVGQRIKVLLKEIDRTGREPQLILSRASSTFLRLLFEKEVPEMLNGAVEIKAIAREAGARSKIAVFSNVPNVDPVGTLIGGRGIRVQTVNNEIGHQEKIDIVVWDKDPQQNVMNALSTENVISVTIVDLPDKQKLGRAKVIVTKDQLSVVIGKSGNNVRLAGKLTGFDIDIVDEGEIKPKVSQHKLQRKEQLEESLLQAVEETNTDGTTPITNLKK